MFIDFANFYRQFIKGFSRIAVLLTSLLKTTGLSESAPKTFKVDDNKVVVDGGSRANEMFVNLSKNNKSRNLICMPNIGAIKKSTFLTSNAKKTFNHLQLAFVKALIL